MNYLTELLAFFRWMEQQRLSPLLQAFWHYLMYFNNRAAIKGADGFWYWPVEFRVPNKLFQDALGLKNRQALWTQRQTLIRKQHVTYTPDAGNRAGQYRLIPFDKGLAPASIAAGERQEPTLVWTQTATESGHGAQPYINNINPKQASLFYHNQEEPPNTHSIHGFNLLPPLTESEKAAIQALYPGDSVAAFNAMWAAREAKQKGETT